MKVLAHMDSKPCGLYYTTMEIADYIERAGHEVCIKKPGKEAQVVYGTDKDIDIHSIHSQLAPAVYHDKKPKIMWMHGEPLSSVGNGISMKAIVDLAPSVDAFVCMRQSEYDVWSSIRRTFVVTKGIDLEKYRPLSAGEITEEKLSGEPAVLYCENWRGNRNPLYLMAAMEKVWQRNPKARLHLYNCNDQKMMETFKALIHNNKWTTFTRSLCGSVATTGKNAIDECNKLYNRADIVVSCLHPLYARVIEGLGAGKAILSPGYREHDYPWTCDLDPTSMAEAIEACWNDYDRVDYRKYAEQHHDVRDTVSQALKIYERYIG